MGLKVMCAGCSAEERERAESDVRRALGTRATGTDTWIVSVINLQSRWSVILDGPGIRALNCSAPPGRLAEAIQEALQARAAPHAAAAPAAAPAAPSPPSAASPPPSAPSRVPSPAPSPPPERPAFSATGGSRRDRHECGQCHQRFTVAFEAIAGEAEHMTPVACPHCWRVNRVPVGETAADTNDYRAEKG